MLEQIQQMITTTIEGQTLILRQEMTGMKTELRYEMTSMESRLGERIEESKRFSGILAEDLHHKLDLVIEGQRFLGQRIDGLRISILVSSPL